MKKLFLLPLLLFILSCSHRDLSDSTEVNTSTKEKLFKLTFKGTVQKHSTKMPIAKFAELNFKYFEKDSLIDEENIKVPIIEGQVVEREKFFKDKKIRCIVKLTNYKDPEMSNFYMRNDSLIITKREKLISKTYVPYFVIVSDVFYGFKAKYKPKNDEWVVKYLTDIEEQYKQY